MQKLNKQIQLRERTWDFRDSSYCRKCHKNNVHNIGTVKCVACKEDK